MGYSISVKFKSKDEKEKMKSFLFNNVELINEMAKLEILGISFHNVPEDGEGLGYAPKEKNLLGFYGTRIPQYIWNICAWMSVKASAKLGENFYFYYDEEKMIVTKDINDKKNTVVDENGVVLEEKGSANFFKDFVLGEKKIKEKQRKFLLELEQKWNTYNLEFENKVKFKV